MGWQAREKEDNTKTVFKIDAHSDGPRECITRWHNVTRSPRLFRPLPRRDEQKCPTYRTVERTQKRCRSGHEEDVPKVARTWRLDKSSGEGSPRTAAVGSITAQEVVARSTSAPAPNINADAYATPPPITDLGGGRGILALSQCWEGGGGGRLCGRAGQVASHAPPPAATWARQ